MSIKTLLTVIFCFIIFDVVGQDTITIDSNRNLSETSQDSIVVDVEELEYWDNDNLFPYYDVKVEDVDSFEVCLKRDTSLRFVIPHHGRISSRFGPRRGRLHKGFDIRLTIGDSVLAVYPGVVRYAKYNKGGYGKLIDIPTD
jgi:murein DD-endopeptidase MepM/ murein hydrolase activator NlpD